MVPSSPRAEVILRNFLEKVDTGLKGLKWKVTENEGPENLLRLSVAS